MGFGFSFGSGKNKSSSSSSTTATVKRFDEASKAVLDNLTAFLSGNLPSAGKQFSRENAISDVQGIVSSIFDKYKTTALPQIAMGMQGAGVYGSTAGQNLANEAFGKATADSAAIVMDNIAKYATLAQQDQSMSLSGLLNALTLQKEAYQTSTEKSVGSASSKSSGFGLFGNND